MSELPPRDQRPPYDEGAADPAAEGSELTRSESTPLAEREPAPLPGEPAPAPVTEREQRRLDRERARHEHPQGMVPGRERRRFAVERIFVRLIATGGIVAIAVALGAILTSQDVAGWIVGLAIGLVTVILAALLWSSREL